MDITYQLPFPEETCNKIFFYLRKSPHTGLGIAMFKNKLQIMNKEFSDFNTHIPEMDKDVIYLDEDTFGHNYVSDIPNILLYLNCFYNLSKIYLSDTDVNGDIEHLTSLPKLTDIQLNNTGVTGDIAHLKSLLNLTWIHLGNTGVTGDIEHLKSLLNLTGINLGNTGVTGNIEHLKSLLNLTVIDFVNTSVTGNIAHLNSLRNLTGINGAIRNGRRRSGILNT